MTDRAVVSVATGSYCFGQDRLAKILEEQGEKLVKWRGHLPAGSPPHVSDGHLQPEQDPARPYAFKAYALEEARRQGFTTLLWADACIKPVQPLTRLWELIEKQGYWFCANGFTNDQWTADSAYPDLFQLEIERIKKQAECMGQSLPPEEISLHVLRKGNSQIQHVVATAFGVDLTNSRGRAFLDEYFYLASKTRAFCGPWVNGPKLHDNPRQAPCGPPTTLGHRHDQAAASVLAWRQGMVLTSAPDLFAYANKDGSVDPRTILVADGEY